MKKTLTIAGSDCSGGAGIEADLKTFSALGTYGMSVIVSVVAENTCRVISVADIDTKIIEDQIDAVFEDIPPDAVKIGMLSSAEIMKSVAKKLVEYRPRFTVVDPVMIAKGGCALMKENALDTLRRDIIPLSFLLTPNIPEAETILGKKIESEADMENAAREIQAMGAKNVLIKGGHLNGDATDILFGGNRVYRFSSARIDSKHTHGTGCTLSSAIAANLALGASVPDAVELAKEYVRQAIENAYDIGKGHGPTNHFYEYYNMKGFN